MKNDLPYFSHDNNARNHPKMKALRAQYGPAGYGLFWILNEMISQAEYAQLDLSKKIYRAATASELGMTLEQFDAFLAFLSDPEYDLVNYQNGILTTDRTQDDFSVVMGKRKRDQAKYYTEKDSASGNANSDNGKPNSASGNDTEHSTAQHNREELASAPFISKDEEGEFAAFAMRRALERKAKNPTAMAKKLMSKPDVIADFKASRKQPDPSASSNDIIPDIPVCRCGGFVKANLVQGEAVCVGCKTSWTYDRAFEVWTEDREAETG